jgi:hypothetical protein
MTQSLPASGSPDSPSWETRQHLHDGQVVSSTEFPYDAVEDEAGILCDELPAAKLSIDQARVILVWHRLEMRAGSYFDASQMLARALQILMATTGKNLQLELNCLAIAAALDSKSEERSQAELARKLKISRAAVSKNVGKWKDFLGYTVTKFTRNDQNRKNCSDAQTQNHWRDERPNKARRFRGIA